MPQKRRNLDRRDLLESRLSELVVLIKDLSPQSQVAISHAQYEDEDAHVSVYPPPAMGAEEVRRLELAVGERCNDILVETGLFIIGAVCD